MAKVTTRHVERRPPYHCELNPIELIWGQTENGWQRNTKFKMTGQLFQEAVDNVTAENCLEIGKNDMANGYR